MQNIAKVKTLAINKMASLTEFAIGKKDLDVSIRKI